MAGIVIIGAGVVGLGTAILLAGDGHQVTVLERDPAPPPGAAEAWERWQRPGLNQFRLLVLRPPREVFARPGLRDKTLRLGSGWRDEEPLGPGREQLVALVSAP